jgi:hypothetical protein
MRIWMTAAALALAASVSALAQQGPKHAPNHAAPQQASPQRAQQQHCPMCGQMMPPRPGAAGGGGMMGGGMMNPQMMQRMMQHMAEPATVTVAPNGSVYVLRGGVLFKYDSNLKLIAHAQLPPVAGATHAQPGAAGGDHRDHH